MTSSIQTFKLNQWDFNTDGKKPSYFPISYDQYNRLLSTEFTRYTQDDKYNKINLNKVFDSVIGKSGFSNTIIDVYNSNRTGNIEKAKEKTSDIDEVIVVSKLKDGKKSLIGLFRGSCGGGDKKGFLNFSIFGSFSGNTKKCAPNNTYSQIAYFRYELFEAYRRSRKITDRFFSEYSDSNILNYIFYYGNVATKDESICKHGLGTMFRKLYYGGYEIIHGTWGGGHSVDSENYSEDFVSGASAYRISNDGGEIIEGIAKNGNWYNGRYVNGDCLSWRLDFGNDMVFDYTGTLDNKHPKEWGMFSFYDITYQKTYSKMNSVMTKNIKSVVFRSFTVPVSKSETESSTETKSDTGIVIRFSKKESENFTDKVEDTYIGDFEQGKHSENGYGVQLFLGDENLYIYVGSTGSDSKYGILYKLIPKTTSSSTPTPTTSDVSKSSKECDKFDIAMIQYGKFDTLPINKNSKAFGDVYYRSGQSLGSSKEIDERTAKAFAEKAVVNFYTIKDRYQSELTILVKKVEDKFSALTLAQSPELINTEGKCVVAEYNKIQQYNQLFY